RGQAGGGRGLRLVGETGPRGCRGGVRTRVSGGPARQLPARPGGREIARRTVRRGLAGGPQAVGRAADRRTRFALRQSSALLGGTVPRTRLRGVARTGLGRRTPVGAPPTPLRQRGRAFRLTRALGA